MLRMNKKSVAQNIFFFRKLWIFARFFPNLFSPPSSHQFGTCELLCPQDVTSQQISLLTHSLKSFFFSSSLYIRCSYRDDTKGQTGSEVSEGEVKTSCQSSVSSQGPIHYAKAPAFPLGGRLRARLGPLFLFSPRALLFIAQTPPPPPPTSTSFHLYPPPPRAYFACIGLS